MNYAHERQSVENSCRLCTCSAQVRREYQQIANETDTQCRQYRQSRIASPKYPVLMGYLGRRGRVYGFPPCSTRAQCRSEVCVSNLYGCVNPQLKCVPLPSIMCYCSSFEVQCTTFQRTGATVVGKAISKATVPLHQLSAIAVHGDQNCGIAERTTTVD